MIKGLIKYSILATFLVGAYFAIRQISKYIPHAIGFFVGLGYNVFDIIKAQISGLVFYIKYAYWYVETALAWGTYYVKVVFAYSSYYSEVYTGSALVLPAIIIMSAIVGIIYFKKSSAYSFDDEPDYRYT